MAVWSDNLRALREKEQLTRQQLAQLASVAPATVKAYELGHRNPSRQLLTALLAALKADTHSRARILEGAGFAADGATPAERLNNDYFTFEEAVEEIARSPFPACVSNEVMEVMAANPLMLQVWEIEDIASGFESSMMSMLSWPRVADRIENWDEAVSLVISIVKGHYGGDAAITEANPYFAAAMEHFLKGDPRYVTRFLALWRTTPGRMRKIRFSYPITWRHSMVGSLRFLVQANPADRSGGLYFNDWMPTDGRTWDALALLRAGAEDGLGTARPD
jgi:transcriptional regulator with XRE-family HTH domain